MITLQLKDYTEERAVIEPPVFYYPSLAAKLNNENLLIRVPTKIRREMRISKYNESDFRVIIVRVSK